MSTKKRQEPASLSAFQLASAG